MIPYENYSEPIWIVLTLIPIIVTKTHLPMFHWWCTHLPDQFVASLFALTSLLECFVQCVSSYPHLCSLSSVTSLWLSISANPPHLPHSLLYTLGCTSPCSHLPPMAHLSPSHTPIPSSCGVIYPFNSLHPLLIISLWNLYCITMCSAAV